jgi:hypothetical protein
MERASVTTVRGGSANRRWTFRHSCPACPRQPFGSRAVVECLFRCGDVRRFTFTKSSPHIVRRTKARWIITPSNYSAAWWRVLRFAAFSSGCGMRIRATKLHQSLYLESASRLSSSLGVLRRGSRRRVKRFPKRAPSEIRSIFCANFLTKFALKKRFITLAVC